MIVQYVRENTSLGRHVFSYSPIYHGASYPMTHCSAPYLLGIMSGKKKHDSVTDGHHHPFIILKIYLSVRNLKFLCSEVAKAYIRQ